MTTEGRRPLSFATLDQVMPDVDRLTAGYESVGNWSLGQICNHLTGALTTSVEGTSFKAPWLVRTLVAPFIFKRIMKTGQMTEGVKLPKAFLPREGLDDRAEVEALRAALGVFAAHSGPVAAHPFFGPISRADWERLHCIHCAHHLSFVHPNGAT
jgi:hypothetical protein